MNMCTHCKVSDIKFQDLTKVVERGAQLLDERAPGWFTQINRDTLDLCMTDKCVLGQLFGLEFPGEPYDYGLDWLGLMTDQDALAHGFTLNPTAGTGFREWAALTLLWLDVIEERLNG